MVHGLREHGSGDAEPLQPLGGCLCREESCRFDSDRERRVLFKFLPEDSVHERVMPLYSFDAGKAIVWMMQIVTVSITAQ